MGNDKRETYIPVGLLSTELYAERVMKRWKNEMRPLNRVKSLLEKIRPYFGAIVFTLLIYVPFGLFFAYLAMRVVSGGKI